MPRRVQMQFKVIFIWVWKNRSVYLNGKNNLKSKFTLIQPGLDVSNVINLQAKQGERHPIR